MKWILRFCDIIHLPKLFEIIWPILTKTSSLTKNEIAAASLVLGTRHIKYNSIRVAEGGVLRLIFKLNKGRAFTTFNIVNMPSTGRHSRSYLDIIVHELVHVYQYIIVGSIYILQALRAQRKSGYEYGGWKQLEKDWADGKHFRDYNREQQGQIAQDYYNEVIAKNISDRDPICRAYEPFINELRSGEL